MTAISEMTLCESQVEAITARLAATRVGMEARGVEAMLVSNDEDVRYLADCFGHDTRLLLTIDRAILLSDRRYEEYLAP